MKKIYLLLLCCFVGKFAFATIPNVALSAPFTTPAANVCANATDVGIYGFTLTWSGGSSTVTGVSFTQSGSAVVPGDVLRYHLRLSSNGSLISTSTTPNFTGLTLTQSVSYSITADIAAAPNQGHTIIVNAMSGTNLTVSTGTTSTTGAPAAGGTQTILIAPVAITGNAQMCTNGPTITLNETSIGGTWSGGIGGVATINEGASLTVTVTPGGTQNTTTISYSNICNSASITATVNATPSNITGNAQMCAGGTTITLANTSTNGTWSGGTVGVATINEGTSLTTTVTPGGTQNTTTISYSNICGSASITATVNALPAPIGGNPQLCANGSTTTLTNTSTNGTWSGGTGGIATVNSSTGLVHGGLSAGTTTINYSNGCSPAATVTVTVNALPSIYTFTGGGAYCAGDPGVHAGLTLSDPGISYQLYNGSTPAGAAVAGTGGAIDFGLYNTPGVYHAVATNTVTTCTSYLSGVTISINPLPDTFTVTGGGSFCAAGTGVHVGLDSSASGINYQLYNGSSLVGSTKPGTGHALDFGLQTGAGVYTVIASNAITFCPQAMAGSATVTVLPLPTIDTVTGGGGYCHGDTGVLVGLSGSETGVAYQLYRGATTVGAAINGTGSPISFGLQTAVGTYTFTVVATNTTTHCTNNMWGSKTVTVNSLPVIDTVTVTNGGRFCIGDTGVHVGLDTSSIGVNYQLFNGPTAVGSPVPGTGHPLDFGLTTTTGFYTVTATNATTGCTANMNGNARVRSTAVVVPTVSLSTNVGAGSEVCLGSVDTFKASTTNGGFFFPPPTFAWTVNGHSVGTPGAPDSSYHYIPNNGDTVIVALTSTAQCARPPVVYDTMIVSVDTPLPPSVFIDVTPLTSLSIGQPDTLIAIPTNCGASPRYQWSINGNIVAGATSATFISHNFNNGDSVCCVVTTSGVCGGRVTVNCVVITVYPASVTQVTGSSDIRLIPNPNKGEFMIKGTLNSVNDEDVSVEITNMLGQDIYKSNVMTQNGIINERIQLSNKLPNGMYILNLKSENETKVFRFVVEQ